MLNSEQASMPLNGEVLNQAPKTANAIKEYSATEAGLNALREKYKGKVFEVATPKGDKEARAARQELLKLRTALEGKRKEIKAPALAHAALIDTEAKRIEAAIRELESPIDAQIKAQEKIDADAKAERERLAAIAAAAEQARIDVIKAKIEGIRTLPFNSRADSLDDLKATLADLDTMEVTEEAFAEFVTDAEAVVLQAMTELLAMVTAAEERATIDAALSVEREKLAAAQKKIDDDAAELAALRAEKAARDAAAAAPAVRTVRTGDMPIDHEYEWTGSIAYLNEPEKEGVEPDAPQQDTAEAFAELEQTLTTMLGDDAPATAPKAAATVALPGFARDVARLSGKQFQALSRKAAAAGFAEFAGSLLIVGQQLINGDFDAQIATSDLSEFYSADADLVNISRDEMDVIEPLLGEE
jgi:hypothetical protein